MLDTIRGSSLTSHQGLEDDLDDLDDVDQLDPVSPTKDILDRHRNISPHSQVFSRHRSAQKLGSAGRRRGRIRATLVSDPLVPAWVIPPFKYREDMPEIDRMNSNTTESPQSEPINAAEDVGPSKTLRTIKKTGSINAPSASGVEGASCRADRPSASYHEPRATSQTIPSQTHSSPDNFDQFSSELVMDGDEIEELTQFERASTSMSSNSLCTNLVSCPSSSTESPGIKKVSHVRKELSDLDMRTSLNGPKSNDTSKSSRSPVPVNLSKGGGSSEDEFDDIDLGDDFEDDIDSNVRFDDQVLWKLFTVNISINT